MGQRILLFESDAAFSQELRENFEALGATVDVASDGGEGIDLASAHKPDLILLSIELPGMNGFLVCKKIKKLEGLANVPLLILSSEATEDVFDQHKKLRTRAEDYIHKPIAFADLLVRVQQFVTIESNGVGTSSSSGDDAIEIADLDEDEVILMAEESVAPPARDNGASDAELFAEEAVEALVADEPEPAPLPPIAPPIFSTASFGAPPPVGLRSSSGQLPAVSAPPAFGTPHAGSSQELARVQQELQQLQARAARVEAELAQAERRANSAEQELQLTKQRAASAERSLADASKKGGVSSRDFLDLREQLNRKDRELLALRDQVSSRDKQLIEASDKGLTFERELADQSDKNLELQRELEKASEVAEALQADKEGSKKRLEDLRARLERSEQRAREVSEELSGIKTSNQQEIMALAQQHAEASAVAEASQRTALEQASRQHAAEINALSKSHADEVNELREEHELALSQLREESERQRQAQLAAQRSELEAEAQRRASELESAAQRRAGELEAASQRRISEVEVDARRRMSEQQQKYETQASQALAAHESELGNTRQSLESKHTNEVKQLNDRYQQELARAGRSLAELETKQQLLQDQLEEAESGRSDAYARLARVTAERDQKAERSEGLQAQLDQLNAKREAQEQMLERARKALAIGLHLLEEQKRGGVDEQTGN